MAALSLVLIAHFLGFNPSGSAIVVAYSKGWISFQSAGLSLATLFGSSGIATAILSQVTVGSILSDATAAALVGTTLLGWAHGHLYSLQRSLELQFEHFKAINFIFYFPFIFTGAVI